MLTLWYLQYIFSDFPYVLVFDSVGTILETVFANQSKYLPEQESAAQSYQKPIFPTQCEARKFFEKNSTLQAKGTLLFSKNRDPKVAKTKRFLALVLSYKPFWLSIS